MRAAEDVYEGDFLSEEGYRTNIFGPIPVIGIAVTRAKAGDHVLIESRPAEDSP